MCVCSVYLSWRQRCGGGILRWSRSGWVCGADAARFFAACLIGSSYAVELRLGLPESLFLKEVVSCPDVCLVACRAVRAPSRADGLCLSPGSTVVPAHVAQRLPRAHFKGRSDGESCTGSSRSSIFQARCGLTDHVPKPLVEKQRFVRQCPPLS